jgi:hypothetical protein
MAISAIEAKLARANELLGNLGRELDIFKASVAPPRIEKGYKPGTSIYAFFAHGELDVPLRFSVLAGEIVHQLRSSLDHLVAHLVMSNGGMLTSAHQFPICSTPERYRADIARGRLRGISESLQSRIEHLQPYKAEDPRVSPLLGLQELNNSDKHRLLVVVAAAAKIGREIKVGCGEDATITGMSPPDLHRRNGSEFFSIDFQRCYRDTNVDIDVETVVALERPPQLDWPFERAPLVSVLGQCMHAVHQVKVSLTCA